MGTQRSRVMYLGTATGLLRAEERNGKWQAERMASVVTAEMRSRRQPPAGLPWRALTWLDSDGEDAGDLVIDRDDPQRLYLGTMRDGLFRSLDHGRSWAPMAGDLPHRHIWCLVQHPQTGELYAGTEPAAIYKSSDRGDSWTQLEGIQALPRYREWAFPTSRHTHHVKDIALSPDQPLLIYGAVEEGWLIRSSDGGQSWSNLCGGMEYDAHAVALIPGRPGVVVATSGKGCYRSTDHGDHFSKQTRGLDREYLSPPAQHPERPGFLLLSAARHPPNRWFGPFANADSAFYVSEDEGQSWQRVPDMPPLKGGSWTTSADPGDPDTFCVGLHDGTVWLTADGCHSFRQVLHGLGSVGRVHLVRE